MNVFVTRPLPDGGLRILKEADDIDVLDRNLDDRPLTREEILEAVKGRDGILTILHDKIDDEVMAAGDKLKVISNYAVGLDNIDIEAATRRGIMVTHTPGVLTDATADLTWALILGVARRIVEVDQFTRAGKYEIWGPNLLLGSAVAGKTLGIIGTGRIGTGVALRSRGFGMNVVYTDIQTNLKLESELRAEKVDLQTLLKQSDYVSIHVPLTDKTHHLIGAKEIALMKKTAHLINTARGPIVDEAALAAALKEGRIAGAGLDVYEKEPEVHPDLIDLPNVLLLPHVGSATYETRLAMANLACENLIKALRGERPPHPAN
jgi:glyoxylate reductase